MSQETCLEGKMDNKGKNYLSLIKNADLKWEGLLDLL